MQDAYQKLLAAPTAAKAPREVLEVVQIFRTVVELVRAERCHP